MFSWDDPDDRVAIVQMNAELRHAQLELLSAECATQQLRLRFSTQDIARHGERDVLRKAIAGANALYHYYSSVRKHIPGDAALAETLDTQQTEQANTLVLTYLRAQRDRYYPGAEPLSTDHKAMMRPFFSPGILERVRVVELRGDRVPNPPFYENARALGLTDLPQVKHMASLTFIDVIVFNDEMTDRALFHGLVHAVQFQILGVERYTRAFVSGFLRTNAHFTVPLEAQTFALESRFAQNPAAGFSVEEQVRLWVRENRY
jgi:hypothetical protein